jgi:hypothetical protein
MGGDTGKWQSTFECFNASPIWIANAVQPIRFDSNMQNSCASLCHFWGVDSLQPLTGSSLGGLMNTQVDGERHEHNFPLLHTGGHLGWTACESSQLMQSVPPPPIEWPPSIMFRAVGSTTACHRTSWSSGWLVVYLTTLFNTPASYSGVPGFKNRSWRQAILTIFVVVLSPSGWMQG